MDAIALPIQLDAPIRAYDTDGTEYRIEKAVMRDGTLCLYLEPTGSDDEHPTVDDDEVV